MEAWHLFVIDVTATAMRMGATASVCAATRAAVEVLAQEVRARVAIMTFDDRVHFYSVSGGRTHMMIMPDIEVRRASVVPYSNFCSPCTSPHLLQDEILIHFIVPCSMDSAWHNAELPFL
jgi:hypothetical protein